MRPLVLAAAVLSLAALACAASPAPPADPLAGPLAAGERLYRSKCAGCHRAYPPSRLEAARWAEVLSRMAPKARLSEDERARVLEYLQAHAKDAGAAGSRP